MKLLKKSFIAKIIILSIFGLTFSSCLGDNETEVECYDSLYIGVKDVTGPVTASINESITFNVFFEVESTCGSFQGFYEEATGTNEKTIAVQAKYLGCNCTIGTVTRIAPYTFKALATGTYTLKFKITNTSFKTITVVVS
ncbi:hypothetical protein [Flavobacterium pallidum]|uniref:GOLD domain-containing protein n=1 Tax=Flavobacterium pallidum TaxID=2172098 RepID=A0A2S1SHU0_9FLAO|nr:hypothetical protein [Flavobacterium pallidum]AWI25978.1 hypothetical protein HYN49_08730 [Flavobacterium pallidum]